MNAKTVIAKEVAPLTKGRVSQAPPTDMPLADLTVAYAILNHLEKVVAKRKEALKPHLISAAEIHGAKTEKGGNELVVGDEKVIREKRTSSEPDHDKLKALLSTAEIGLFDCFEEVKTLQLNPSKLAYLVEIGKLKAEQVEALRAFTFALKVEPGKELKELLLEACGAVEDDEEDKPKRGRPRGRR